MQPPSPLMPRVVGYSSSMRPTSVTPTGLTKFLDGDVNPSEWQVTPNGNVSSTTASLYVDVDLGAAYDITAVTIWHYYLDTRQYYSQTIEISETGQFSGEEVILYETGAGKLGPVETAAGNKITTSSPILGRYIRHRCGRSTRNTGVHFIEMKVDNEPPAVSIHFTFLFVLCCVMLCYL